MARLVLNRPTKSIITQDGTYTITWNEGILSHVKEVKLILHMSGRTPMITLAMAQNIIKLTGEIKYIFGTEICQLT